MIITQNLRVVYGARTAVDNLCLDIPTGEIFGLLGANGAGKTTTFRVLASLLEPTSGEVILAGLHLRRERAAARSILGYMPDLAPVPTDLKVGEFLEVMAHCHGLRGVERDIRVRECLEAVHLHDRRSEWCRSLSRGMKQRLVLARNLLHRPRVLVLDEPASGMDPASRVALRTVLRELVATGVTVLLSSHILAELSGLCTSIGLLQQGRLLDSGPVGEVLQRHTPGRRLRLRLAHDAAAAALLAWLRERAEKDGLLTQFRTSASAHGTPDAIAECSFSGDDAEQSQLIQAIYAAGFSLVSCQEMTATIEDVVLSMQPGEEGMGFASMPLSTAA